ncbi:hypothetical protein [Kitasatospora sp. NPDC088134]|uniref:hypothetical protein n=1 Tax=Kitasatospora sp. NPDC088134 TaxID=3364071 RepID=UPI00382AAB98
MTPPTTTPVAQKRKRRTRTTNVSHRPALTLSTLLPNNYELLPGGEHLRCPDCETWCPLTTDKGSQEWKQAPHHTERAGTPGARRCPGSNRRVLLDLTIAQWQERLADAAKETASRRPTTVLKKVKAPLPPALHQLAPAVPTADSARSTFETHRRRCAACIDPAKRCTDGLRLEGELRVALYREPKRRAAAARAEQEQRAAERDQAKRQLRRRTAEWAERYPVAETTDMVRRSLSYALPADSRTRLYGPDLRVEERDTREQARARAEARTEAAIRRSSPLRRQSA